MKPLLARRTFLAGMASALAAPAIVRVQSIMPVKAMPTGTDLVALLQQRLDDTYTLMKQQVERTLYYSSGDAPLAFNGYTAIPLDLLPSGEYLFVQHSVPISWEHNK